MASARFSPASCSAFVSWAALLLTGVLLTGCISSQPASAPSEDPARPASTADASSDASPSGSTPSRSRTAPDPAGVERDLRTVSAQWDGVPHKWGGTTKRGVDCSGLVQNLYADVFDLQMPRTTRRQARVGTEVRRDRLQPGDLVFFRPGRKKRHVGVYLSDGEFVHASSSSGVTVSNLGDDYWTSRWWQARRVVGTYSTADTDSTASSPPPSQRTGW